MLTPIKAIRAKCLDCCCGNMAEASRCPAENCALHPFRFGKNPNYVMTPAKLAALEKARLSRETLVQAGDTAANPTTEGKDTTPDIFAPEA